MLFLNSFYSSVSAIHSRAAPGGLVGSKLPITRPYQIGPALFPACKLHGRHVGIVDRELQVSYQNGEVLNGMNELNEKTNRHKQLPKAVTLEA